LAAQFAASGATVVGCDIDPEVVKATRRGEPHFSGESGLAERLSRVVADGRMTATSNTRASAAECDVIVVVVPLVVDARGEPIWTAIDGASREIALGLQPGTLVVYETTVPVGTTRTRFGRILSEGSDLEPGRDFHLAFSPERVYSGRVFQDLRRYPKLVGGIDEESSSIAAGFYRSVLEFDERDDLPRPNGVWDLGSVEAAELAKLAETTYRDVNIALANEFAFYAETLGIDIKPVIDAANSQPFSHIHRPGIVGGHCIPVYPRFYLKGHSDALLPAAGRTINESVARNIVGRILSDLGSLEGLTATILGATYRGGVKETAFSGVFSLARELEEEGASVRVHDPMMTEGELAALGLGAFTLGSGCDIAILQADHAEYSALGPDDLPGCRLVFDLRGVVDEAAFRGVAPVQRLGSGTRLAWAQPA
jgi:nucleotide sugar dehydrogenase